MQIPLATTESYRQILAQIQSDLSLSVTQVVAAVRAEELAPALSSVIDPYLELGSMTAATFYDELRVLQGAGGRYAAQVLTQSEAERVTALTGWGLSGAGKDSYTASTLTTAITGGASRILTERVNDTMIGNAEADVKVDWKYQRVPRPTCCAFCGMLASRGAVYTSQSTAGMVVGAGTEIPKGPRGRGGQAKGVKPRGSRRMGEEYHDNCYCTVVCVMNGNGVELSNEERDTAQAKWWNLYEVGKVDAGEDYHPEFDVRTLDDGSQVKSWHWVDSKGNKFKSKGVTDRIVNSMRREKYALDKTGDF